MLDTLDAAAVRAWCRLALDALGEAREEIDAINVYPVADGDTGTNLYLTVESAAQAVDAVFTAHAVAGTDAAPALGDVVRAMAHGALIGARGNSGVILAQLLRGMSEVLAPDEPPDRPPAPASAGGPGGAVPAAPAPRTPSPDAVPGPAAGPSGGAVSAVCAVPVCDAVLLRTALGRASASAYEAVARPVEGTVLTVAAAAAAAADRAEGGLAAVCRAAHEGALAALAATPGQLDVLGRAGVVDAGGRGLVAVLGALADAVAGDSPMGPLSLLAPGGGRVPVRTPPPDDCEGGDPHAVPGGPAFEVIYLLEADGAALPALRSRLGVLGDSLVVVGGDGLWNVHVHVDDAGAAVEAGIEAGRPYRIRITHFGTAAAAGGRGERSERTERAGRGVVSVVHGEGLARLCAEAGATVVRAEDGLPPASGDIAGAVRRAHAHEVVLLPNDAALRSAAGAAAERARQDGVRVAVIPTRSPVQGIAALAVHEPGRRFDEDVVAMTAAAGATRCAELAVAESRSWTTAGVCQAGDVLGLIDGDVAVIGGSLEETAATVVDRMLAAGGEMLTLVLGDGVPDSLAAGLEARVRDTHITVGTVVYRGGQTTSPLLIGVE